MLHRLLGISYDSHRSRSSDKFAIVFVKFRNYFLQIIVPLKGVATERVQYTTLECLPKIPQKRVNQLMWD